MLIVQNSLVSDDLVEQKFCCDCPKCMGMCCIEGDAGAPYEEEEIKVLQNSLMEVYKFMTPEGVEAIEKQGVFVIDPEGKKVTPLIKGKECAFVVYINGIANCAIELTYIKKKISLQKPISCHLYPVRIIDYEDFFAVNYHEWAICKPALEKGEKEGIFMYEFLKKPLIRKFGKSWYTELEKIAEYMRKKISNG